MHRALIAASILILAGCSSETQRLIEVRITQGEVFALQTQFGVAEDETPAQIWGRLGQHQFKSRGFHSPNSSEPETLILGGKVRITLRHAGEPLESAEVEELRLKRTPGTMEYWTLPQNEVERIKKAAGL